MYLEIEIEIEIKLHTRVSFVYEIFEIQDV